MKVKRINNIESVDELVDMHRDLFIGSQLYGKLIYFDDAFSHYLRKIIIDEAHFFYGLFFNNKLEGFIHFRILENELFLNNIFINYFKRGGGYVSRALRDSVNDVILIHPKIKQIGLDVLESNIKAKEWYKKLGLRTASKKDWFKILVKEQVKCDNMFEIKKDENRFQSLYYKNGKVGTIINNRYLIAHSDVTFNYKNNFEIIYLGYESQLKSEYIGFEQFDAVHRMNGDIRNLLNKK